MENNGVPEDTKFRLIGGSIWMKIPPNRVSHLELEHLKKQDSPDEHLGKCMAEQNEDEEKYISGWNPKADSQQDD